MMEEFTLSSNIPRSAMNYTNNDRKRVQNIMQGMTNLILQGVKVEFAYHSVKHGTKFHNVLKVAWERKVKELLDPIKNVDIEVQNNCHDQIETEVDEYLAKWHGISHADFATRLFNVLTAKYDWKEWLVVAYDKLDGYKNQFFCNSFSLQKFGIHGRNVFVGSVDKNKQPINLAHTHDLFKRANAHRTFSWNRGLRLQGAKFIYNDVFSTQLRCGSTYASVGVIRLNSGLTHKAPHNRFAYFDMDVGYSMYAFV